MCDWMRAILYCEGHLEDVCGSGSDPGSGWATGWGCNKMDTAHLSADHLDDTITAHVVW